MLYFTILAIVLSVIIIIALTITNFQIFQKRKIFPFVNISPYWMMITLTSKQI